MNRFDVCQAYYVYAIALDLDPRSYMDPRSIVQRLARIGFSPGISSETWRQQDLEIRNAVKTLWVRNDPLNGRRSWAQKRAQRKDR